MENQYEWVQEPAARKDEYDRLAAVILGVEVIPLHTPQSLKNIGGLRDDIDQELTAAVCKLCPGMTADRWAGLSLGERLPWLREAASRSKRRGRPPKNEKCGETLVRAALVKHHDYEFDGRSPSVSNPSPVDTLSVLAKLAGVDKSTVSRILQKRCGGFKQYKACCNRDKLAGILMLWSGDTLQRQPSLRPEESGEGEDDE